VICTAVILVTKEKRSGGRPGRLPYITYTFVVPRNSRLTHALEKGLKLRSLSAWVCATKRARRGKGHDTTRAFVEAVTTAALPFHRETTMNRLED
jgi:hypothetical protein